MEFLAPDNIQYIRIIPLWNNDYLTGKSVKRDRSLLHDFDAKFGKEITHIHMLLLFKSILLDQL